MTYGPAHPNNPKPATDLADQAVRTLIRLLAEQTVREPWGDANTGDHANDAAEPPEEE